jgi:hypothetical protein
VRFDAEGFSRSVALPPGLKMAHIRKAIEYVEEQAEQLIDLCYKQANIFSALIGILGVRALDAFSPYKRHKHPDVAQQRFPDLSLGGRLNPPASQALESKGSSRPWAIQSHYNHAGGYVIWRYFVDPTRRMKPPRVVPSRGRPRRQNPHLWREEPGRQVGGLCALSGSGYHAVARQANFEQWRKRRVLRTALCNGTDRTMRDVR